MSGAEREIIFVPGWSSKGNSPVYETKLKQTYPDAKITIMEWDSDDPDWKKAVSNADALVPEVVKYILEKSTQERENIILIGHSLGGRIVVNSAGQLAEKKLKIQQFILLGAAIDYDADLSSFAAASSQKNISIFSRNDSILKYLYSNYQRKPALGFSGMEECPDYFLQYRFSTSEPVIANTDWKTALLESVNHICEIYFDELGKVMRGELKPYIPEYDYSQIKLKKTRLTLPENIVFTPLLKVVVLDSYGEWTLCQITLKYTHTNEDGTKTEFKKNIYFILDHLGRIRKWNFIKFMITPEFEKIKSQIRKRDSSG